MSNDFSVLNIGKPQSLVDQIYRTLSRAIINAEIMPGQMLTETDLQASFSVSRGPIREAIRLLEADGLVVGDSYKKKYVRRITLGDIEKIVPVMACLEGLAGKLAVGFLTDEKIEQMVKINEKMKVNYTKKNIKKCIELNFKFHKIFVMNANNKFLIKAIRSLIKPSMWVLLTRVYFGNEELIPRSVDEHCKITDLFKKRDANSIQLEIINHVSNILNTYIKPSLFDADGNYIISLQS